MEEDAQQQADELCALRAIYGDDFVTQQDDSLVFAIPEAAVQPHLLLRVHLPRAYPSQPPFFELHDSCSCLPADVLSSLASELECMFCPGEVVLYSWLEHLREQWSSLAPPQQPCDGSGDGAAADAAAQEADSALAAELQAAELLAEDSGTQKPVPLRQGVDRDAEQEAAMAEVVESVVHGVPFTEKRSTFQAHLVPARSLRHVEALVELLLQNNKIRQAAHPTIMAYRIEQNQSGAFLQDYDDDGETAAGSRLLHLLQMTDARNVCVVVSRWFGGILLGPARFTHINNAARELLDACGYIPAKDGTGKGSGKGKKR